MSQNCHLTTLSCWGHCRIDQCEHGHVHLTIRDLTLRLSTEDLCGLADALAVARRQLREPARDRVLC